MTRVPLLMISNAFHLTGALRNVLQSGGARRPHTVARDTRRPGNVPVEQFAGREQQRLAGR